MATNSNVNNCTTSCCVFNFYTQTVYNPNPPRLWSRFNYVCPCPSGQGQAQCSTDFLKLDERRKAEILKYKANSSNITKKQQYANAASNRWLTGRKRSWATQTDTYTNPNTSALQRVGNVLECNNNNVSCSLTSDADVPGKVQSLCYDPTVPLYNYKVTTTYSDGGGKYGLYGRVQVVSLSNFNNITKTFTDPPFDLTPPTSNSPGDFTYTSSNALVATISGITVTIVGLGTCTITATQAAYSNYTSGSISALLTVNPIPPTIGRFTVATPQNYGAAPIPITKPTSNSQGAFTYSSSDTSVATIDVNQIIIVNVGECKITAHQAADGNYSEGTSNEAPFTVNPIPPTIGTFTVATPQNYGAASIPITKPSSNSQGTFTYSSSDTSVATINVNQIIIGNVGECEITAHQAADGNYSEGSSNPAQFVVNPIPPTIGTFTVATPQNYGAAPIPITQPTSNSQGTFTYSSSDTSVATIDVNQIIIVNVGECKITAHQAADGNYSEGTSNEAPFTVNRATPSIGTFTVATPQNYGAAPVPITQPTSNSQGAFTYSSSDTSVATINVNQIIIGNVGECEITAHQAADGNYSEGSSNPAQFVVNQIAPTISLSLPTVYTNTTPFSLTQYTTSNNPSGTFSYTSSNNSVATINEDTLTPVAAGTTIITVYQTANGNYTDGSTPVTLTISLALPNLTWPFTSPQTLVVYPDDSLTLSSPTSNSDGVITLSNANGGDAVGINPTTLNPIPGSNPFAFSPSSFILTGDRVEGVGQVTIVATQAPTNTYAQGIISFLLLIDETFPPDPPDI